MRALITGGASIVGARVAQRLLDAGAEVIAVDDLSSGTFGNVAPLLKAHGHGEGARFAFVEHDVASPFQVVVDLAVHLAVPSGREPDVGRAAVTCVAGTSHVALSAPRIAMATPLARVLPTARAVACAEAIAMARCARIVRVPELIGPGLSPDAARVVVALVLASLRGGARGAEPAVAVGADEIVRVAWIDDVAATLLDGAGESPVVAPYFELTAADLAAVIRGEEPAEAPRAAGSPSVTLEHAVAATVASFEQRLGMRRKKASSGVFTRHLGARHVNDSTVHGETEARARAAR